MAIASLRGGAIQKEKCSRTVFSSRERGHNRRRQVMARTFYERYRPRHRAWRKGHVPAIRDAFKDVVRVATCAGCELSVI